MNHLGEENHKRIEDDIIKNVRYVFRLKKETHDNTIKDKKKNLFRLKNENEAIKDKIIRDIKIYLN